MQACRRGDGRGFRGGGTNGAKRSCMHTTHSASQSQPTKCIQCISTRNVSGLRSLRSQDQRPRTQELVRVNCLAQGIQDLVELVRAQLAQSCTKTAPLNKLIGHHPFMMDRTATVWPERSAEFLHRDLSAHSSLATTRHRVANGGDQLFHGGFTWFCIGLHMTGRGLRETQQRCEFLWHLRRQQRTKSTPAFMQHFDRGLGSWKS